MICNDICNDQYYSSNLEKIIKLLTFIHLFYTK